MKYLNFTAQKGKANDVTDVLLLPKPEEALTNIEWYEKGVVFPKYSCAGHYIHEKYKGFTFHIFEAPIFLDYIDFRLVDNNKYELLRFEKTAIADYHDIEAAAYEMEESFDDADDGTQYLVPKDEAKNGCASTELGLKNILPGWAQAHYEGGTGDVYFDDYIDEDGNSTLDNTDYSLDVFKDENGNTLEFVCATTSGSNLFGYYYQFYSPETKLIRQFFQCT